MPKKLPVAAILLIPLLYMVCCSLTPLSAQRTISGRVFFADGEEQIGCAVANTEHYPKQAVFSQFEGYYSIQLADTAQSLYFNWDGTINPVVPIDDQDTVNVINAYRYADLRIDYPENKIRRSFPVHVSGVIEKDGEPFAKGVIITPMVTENRPLPGVKTDEQGQFHLEVPPEAGVLKVEYDWLIQYFVIPDVRSVFLPIAVDEDVITNKKLKKRLQKRWQRKQKG